MRRLAIALLLTALTGPAAATQNVVNTLHNLSISGPGLIKSATVSRVCVFCHTPHDAAPSGPLWNRQESGTTYLPYESTTLQANPGQPLGQSRLCLACHDGTVALGALVNAPRSKANDLADTFLSGRANLQSDLRDDHPISFAYDAALQATNRELTHPNAIELPLESSRVECTTCHDAHEAGNQPFLRKESLNGALCTTCHDRRGQTWDWATSSHATSTATPRGATPWPGRKPEWRGATVAENACFNCHTPHNAMMPQRLINDLEEDTCYRCHDGTVAATDIKSDFLKVYRHPVDRTPNPDHDAAMIEDPLTMKSHVECEDCHNSHAVRGAPPMVSFNPSNPAGVNRTQAPSANARIAGVPGLAANGLPVAQVSFEYELCFKCHADNNFLSRSKIARRAPQINTRLEFDVSNPSFHPVQARGRNADGPSLIPPLDVNSVIYCTDCHNSDDSPAAGGVGPNGPHGSNNEFLLARRYSTEDFTPESSISYALCYKCHDRSSILSDESFKEHDKHIRGENTPCSTCHDPHGVSSTQGSPINSSHLINFDIGIVQPNAQGERRFEDRGRFAGACFLNCHGKEHNPEVYP